jgi:hypothetical protein
VSVIAAPKNSPLARFHANQGLVLFLASIAYGVVYGVGPASGKAGQSARRKAEGVAPTRRLNQAAARPEWAIPTRANARARADAPRRLNDSLAARIDAPRDQDGGHESHSTAIVRQGKRGDALIDGLDVLTHQVSPMS